MKYIRTKDGEIIDTEIKVPPYGKTILLCYTNKKGEVVEIEKQQEEIIKQADTIEELCDCFIKIKRKKGCKDFILKHDFRDLPLLKEQHIKYPDSPVYGAVNIDDKGLIYVAKMNDKGKLCLL